MTWPQPQIACLTAAVHASPGLKSAGAGGSVFPEDTNTQAEHRCGNRRKNRLKGGGLIKYLICLTLTTKLSSRNQFFLERIHQTSCMHLGSLISRQLELQVSLICNNVNFRVSATHPDLGKG